MDSGPCVAASASSKSASVVDLISQSFPEFDHRGTIVEPFDNEGKRDGQFQDELSKMIIELMLEFHAWSTSRPIHEAETTADTLEKEVNNIMGTEKEQGRSLHSSPLCNHFVGRPIFFAPLPRHSSITLPHGLYICDANRLVLEERTRQRLNDFVERIKMALAALTGL